MTSGGTASVAAAATGRAFEALVPSGVRSGELQRSGRSLRWYAAGSGGPAVVLDAASGTPCLTWAPVLPQLARHTTVIAYDRAGIGGSDAAPRLSVRSQVDDLTALLARAGDGPAVLVGNSWGGQIAQLAARAAPDRVAGLVLLDPAHEDAEPWVGRVIERAFVSFFAVRMAFGAADGALRRTAERNAGRATDDPRVQRLLADGEMTCCARREHVRAVRRENRMISAHARAIRRVRVLSQLPDVPLVVMSATTGMPKGMRARTTALHRGIAAGARRGRHVEVPGAGHYVHQHRPDAVTGAVVGVVDAIRRGG